MIEGRSTFNMIYIGHPRENRILEQFLEQRRDYVQDLSRSIYSDWLGYLALISIHRALTTVEFDHGKYSQEVEREAMCLCQLSINWSLIGQLLLILASHWLKWTWCLSFVNRQWKKN